MLEHLVKDHACGFEDRRMKHFKNSLQTGSDMKGIINYISLSKVIY